MGGRKIGHILTCDTRESFVILHAMRYSAAHASSLAIAGFIAVPCGSDRKPQAICSVAAAIGNVHFKLSAHNNGAFSFFPHRASLT